MDRTGTVGVGQVPKKRVGVGKVPKSVGRLPKQRVGVGKVPKKRVGVAQMTDAQRERAKREKKEANKRFRQFVRG